MIEARQGYRLLPDEPYQSYGYALGSLQECDAEPVRRWRNSQMDILRQSEPLTVAEQQRYFSRQVASQYGAEEPTDILMRYTLEGILIGYGAVVHIGWPNRTGEVSFLLATELSRDIEVHCRHFAQYLRMLARLAREVLGLKRLTTETYAHRERHIGVIEAAGYTRVAQLPDRAIVDGRIVPGIVHELKL